jgi:O-antigen/teichoic acid export membrane protein
MLSKLGALRRSSFLRGNSGDVLAVTAGTLLGQGVIIAATPLLTRLYDPAEMGVYSVYVALVGIFTVIIALHYELAIPLPKGDKEAIGIFKVAVIALAIFSSLVGLLFFWGHERLLPLFRAEELKSYVWLIPVGLALWGLNTVISTWATRKRAFATSAVAKAGQGVGQTLPQLLFGALHFGAAGLIIGQLIGGVVSLLLMRKARPNLAWSRSRQHFRRLLATARKYKRFPLLTTLSSLINSLSAQMPVLLLAYWFSPAVTGYFALSFRVLQVPLRFLGQAVAQVFFSTAAKARHDQTLHATTETVFRRMISFSIPSFALIAMIAPELFAVVFGEEWREAGRYSQWMMPWILMSFVTMVLSILVTILQRQGSELYFQIFYAACLGAALAVGGYEDSAELAVQLLGLAGGIVLAGKVAWLLHLAAVPLRRCLLICLKELPHTSAALLLLGALKLQQQEDWIISAAGIALMICLHLINFFVRGSYGFRRN